MTQPALKLRGLSVAYKERKVLDNVDLQAHFGELVAITGPNGAGKTTLLRAALGLVQSTGTSSLLELSAKTRSKQIAWLPQSREVAWNMTVETIVALGRLPHQEGRAKAQDAAHVDVAIEKMNLQNLRTRTMDTLSGGERARVLLARVLAQDTPIIFADEPIDALDPAFQIEVMEGFKSLAEMGKLVVLTLHDLGHVVRYASRAVIIYDGRKVADGAPKAVFGAQALADYFGITAYYQDTDEGSVFQILERVND